jgi:hypothetical protein
MTVDIRQTGAQWLIEVRGAVIGVADSKIEAQELADYREARMRSLACWRGQAPEPQGQLPECLTGLLVTKSEG